MLKNLLIHNYALINHLEMVPTSGLNIITGETGAGKSILIGALGLVMGNRADTKVLLNTAEKCVVEALFSLADDGLKAAFDEADIDFEPECVLRREIAPSGKSRAFINDTPVSLETLRFVAEGLMDIHSQHDTQKLGSQTYQLALADTYAGLQTDTEAMGHAYKAYQIAEKALATMQDRILQAAREKDFVAYQLNELQKAALQPNEIELLEQELALLAHAEEIKMRLAQADQLLQTGNGDSVSKIKTAWQTLEKAATYAHTLAPLAERLASALVELRDIAAEVETAAERMDFDPKRLDWVQARLAQLAPLLKKHNLSTTAELQALQQQLLQTRQGLDGLEEDAAHLEVELATQLQKATTLAHALTQARLAALPALEAEMAALLADVGMPHARLAIELSTAPLNAQGADQVRILFSANKGIAPQELKTVASGGEFSRLLLCLKYVVASKTNLPTLIFDEIDTGISGEIALRVGRLMARMASRHQLLVITHMPQIAAKGQQHYFVYKQEKALRTSTHIRLLAQEERVQEIAQMIGGANPTATALSSAKELIEAR